jgi:hypothetical protein
MFTKGQETKTCGTDGSARNSISEDKENPYDGQQSCADCPNLELRGTTFKGKLFAVKAFPHLYRLAP